MTRMNSIRPLLLVDVDGVISLFGFDHASPPAGRFEIVDGIAHFLSASAGEHLRELSAEFELVWCTGWEETANEYLPRALGLPAPLPHLEFERNPGRSNGHWKIAAIDTYAGPERPLAWVDDAHDERCTTWADGPLRARRCWSRPSPPSGLTDGHVARDWARCGRRYPVVTALADEHAARPAQEAPVTHAVATWLRP